MTKTQQNRQNKYIDDHYDRINLTVPKGMKAKIQAYALEHGESVNSLLNRLLEAEINKPTEVKLPDLQQFTDFGGTDEDDYIPMPWETEQPTKYNHTSTQIKRWTFD